MSDLDITIARCFEHAERIEGQELFSMRKKEAA